LRGKKVSWLVTVRQAGAQSLDKAVIQPEDKTYPRSHDEQIREMEEAQAMGEYPRRKILFYSLALWSPEGIWFPAPAADWVARLNRGDTVRLKGSVAKVELRHETLPIYDFTIRLQDCTLTPP